MVNEIVLLNLALTKMGDIINARQRVRQIMQLLEFKRSEQTRMATAVSEIARNAYQYAQGGRVCYAVISQPVAYFLIKVTDKGKGIPHLPSILEEKFSSKTGQGLGIMGARRLVDNFTIHTSEMGTQAELRMAIPKHITISKLLLSKISEDLVRNRPSDFSEELLQQNHELIQAFDLLKDARDDLEKRVSERTFELTQTNQMLRNEIERRKETEQDLREVSYRLNLTMEAARVGSWIWHIEKQLLIWDAYTCSLFGIQPQNFDGKFDTLLSFMPPEDRSRFNAELLNNINHNSDLPIEFRACWPDGSIHNLILKGRINYEEDGTATSMEGICWDNTEHVKNKEKIRSKREQVIQTEKISSLREVASSLAHEINQPLAAINAYSAGCIKRIENKDYDTKEILGILQKVRNQAQRAGEVIHRIKSFVRKGQLFYEEVEINELIAESIRLMQHEIEKFAVQASYVANSDIEFIHLDKIQVQQVILNLSRNAMEAMHAANTEQPQLLIEYGLKSDDFIFIRITDNGPGISENFTKLFEAYFTTKPQGMGLGLTISRSIVEAHGGSLMASNLPQGGCAFEFYLPLGEMMNE